MDVHKANKSKLIFLMVHYTACHLKRPGANRNCYIKYFSMKEFESMLNWFVTKKCTLASNIYIHAKINPFFSLLLRKLNFLPCLSQTQLNFSVFQFKCVRGFYSKSKNRMCFKLLDFSDVMADEVICVLLYKR